MLGEKVDLPPRLATLLEHDDQLREVALAIVQGRLRGGTDWHSGDFQWAAQLGAQPAHPRP